MVLWILFWVCLALAVVWVLLWWAFGAHRPEPQRPVVSGAGVSWAGRTGQAKYEAEYAAWVEARREAEQLEAEYAAEWVCVYFIEDGAGRVKVGHSVNPDRRLRALQTGSSARLVLAYTAWFPGDGQARACEADLHARLADRHVRGEWFEAAGLDYGALLDAVSVRLDG